MGLPLTAGLLAVVGAFILFAGWRGSRPVDFARPRLVPWTALLIAGVFVAVLLLVHIVNLAGIRTGGGAGGF